MEEALKSEHAREQKAPADSENKSLIENETWELVELPKDRDAIGCKWVFKVKYTSDGKVERFKARLVAKGYAQKFHVDYDETFSPVVRFSSITYIVSICCTKQHACSPNGCCHSFSQWDIGRRDIYAATHWLHCAKQRAPHLQTKEIAIRFKTVTAVLEQSVL